ncbi:MAG: glycoside hydrolase family 27 protein [Microlunatus sp.]|nr:glycoside hydrolase family 27 protein [Microlunatus sp.]
MGWSSYSMEVYSGDGGNWITADQVIAQSDAMHQKLQPYGYDYINVDAGWTDHADDYGRPAPSSKLFPDGLQKVIDHVHANGQKFGVYLIPGISHDLYDNPRPIYNSPGCTTRDIVQQPLQQADYWGIGYRIDFSNPCAQKYVDSIADQLASWGVNFVKFDSVTPGSGVSDLSLDARDDVAAWSAALHRHGIWFELSWALDINYAKYWQQYADGWRVEWDVECYCTKTALTTWQNIARLFPRAADWWRYAGPNVGWNDLDSLDVGNGSMDGLTQDERRTAATLWAISAAPMSVGNDLTRLDSFGLGLLTNPEVIAVDQAGVPAEPVSTSTNHQVWYAQNPDGSYTVALFNLGSTSADITANWSDLGISGPADVRDLWARKSLGKYDTGYVGQDIPVHGVRLLRVTPGRGAAVTVNDDALRVDYRGDWSRNGGNEVAATAQPLNLAVWDSATGTQPPPPESGRIQKVNDTDPGITYTGTWGYSNNRGLGDYQDDVHYAETDGQSFQYTFQGTGIAYLTELDQSQGDVDIYLDGAFQKTVSTYLDPSLGRKAQQTVWSVSGLPDGTHTLRVVKRSGQFMLLDRLDVTQQSLIDPDTAMFDKSNPSDISVDLARDPGELDGISYNGAPLAEGTDYVLSGQTVTIRQSFLAGLPDGSATLSFAFRGDYHDDIHATTTNGDSVSFTFRGVGVHWITAEGPDQGTAEVYIDGKLARTVDTHNASRVTARDVFAVSGLKDGDHTITVTKTSGDVLRHDMFRYQQK